jgi:CRISPR system Cascade subunit CasE
MVYLSRLIVDARNRTVRHDLADCHALHRRMLAAFPVAPAATTAREHFGLLYRVEPLEHDPWRLRVLVQSAVEPDWSLLPGSYLGASPDARGNPAVRPLMGEYDQVQAGMELLFRLRANPTKRVSTKNTEQAAQWRGKRIELRREEDQLAWLARKGEQGGFRLVGVAVQPDLPDVRVATQEKTRGRQPRNGTPRTLTFAAVLFAGRLQVTDRDAFLATLRGGIGSGKAFGFGLLSVASVG